MVRKAVDRMNDIILTKEVLSNEVVSVNYYTLDGIKYGDKKELVKALNDKGIPMNLITLNLILGNHLVPKFIVSKHPELINFVRDKKNTWQDFYEIYDMYGEEESAWSKFKEPDTSDDKRTLPLQELTSLVKNINMDNVQKYINNAQKAINVIQELTSTSKTPIIPTSVPKTPRPITKFFGD